MDGIFLEFPLCALRFIGNEKSHIDFIISYCIVKYSQTLKHGSKKEKLTESAEFLGITLGNYLNTENKYDQVNSFIQSFTNKYGKDSYCRMGKKLTFEARDGQFDFKQFLVLCAIQSILGKQKKFVRITYERIRYAMQGFKSKKVFEQSSQQVELLSDKQLKRLVDVLHSKKFFSKFTYANRQIYYSTKLEDEQLREAVKNSKIYWKKKQLQIVDRACTNDIKSELDKLNLELATMREQKRLNNSRLRLVKVN
jgi:hypothetical protein